MSKLSHDSETLQPRANYSAIAMEPMLNSGRLCIVKALDYCIFIRRVTRTNAQII
jgi:hypothetical protein